MKPPSFTAALSFFLVLAAANKGAQAATVRAAEDSNCVAVRTTNAEFYRVFASQFRMSDGSAMDASDAAAGEGSRKTRAFATRFMRNVNATVHADESSPDAFSIEMCGTDLLRNALLAVVGNYVSSPGDVALSPPSSTQAVPVVVVDTYTGELVTHVAYSGVRGYFVEALLVVSIAVIARLTFVRNTPYFTFVPASAAADK